MMMIDTDKHTHTYKETEISYPLIHSLNAHNRGLGPEVSKYMAGLTHLGLHLLHPGHASAGS